MAFIFTAVGHVSSNGWWTVNKNDKIHHWHIKQCPATVMALKTEILDQNLNKLLQGKRKAKE